DFATQGCFPFLAGEVSREWLNWPSTHPADMKYFKTMLTTSLVKELPQLACSALVDSADLAGNDDAANDGYDKIHFTAASQARLGERYFTHFTDVVSGR